MGPSVDQPRPFVSRRTRALALAGFGLVVLIEVAAVLHLGASGLSGVLLLLAEGLIEFATAVIVLVVARHLRDRLLRRLWALIGIGVLAASVRDLIWATQLVARGAHAAAINPADFIYLLEYASVSIACIAYGLHFRRRVDVVWPAIEACLMVLVLGFAAWFMFLSPGLILRGGSGMGTWLDVAYASLDIVFLLGPAVFLLLTLAKVGEPGTGVDRTLIVPWVVFAMSQVAVTTADFGWFWQSQVTIWKPGALTDLGFVIASVLIAVAASLELDVDRHGDRELGPTI